MLPIIKGVMLTKEACPGRKAPAAAAYETNRNVRLQRFSDWLASFVAPGPVPGSVPRRAPGPALRQSHGERGQPCREPLLTRTQRDTSVGGPRKDRLGIGRDRSRLPPFQLVRRDGRLPDAALVLEVERAVVFGPAADRPGTEAAKDIHPVVDVA